MKLIAGVDIGNSTTEVCIGSIKDDSTLKFLSSSEAVTTGTKGTLANVEGIITALKAAVAQIDKRIEDLSLIRINEATPVIGDTAMETITETIITESSMIGHNPNTPAGAGQAVGITLNIHNLEDYSKTARISSNNQYILVADKEYPYSRIAKIINKYSNNYQIVGLILQADEAVLVENRLDKKIPIVDEVRGTDKIPEGKLAAIEVAYPGETIRMLSNPYGLATLLNLNPDETKAVTPIAKSLVGKRSAVVIKTPYENVKENVIPAGEIYIESLEGNNYRVNIDAGAEEIMETLSQVENIQDIHGQENTNVGNMFSRIKKGMSEVSDEDKIIRISDILAVDTLAPVPIAGAISGETGMEKAVGIAAMVKTKMLPMEKIAKALMDRLGIFVQVAGVEAVMASLGALTTPGTRLPLAILDLGGGSTDAALIDEDGQVRSIHKAGAGEMVTMLIQTELGLSSRATADEIKKYPLAKVESLYHMRLENGAMKFFEEAIDPRLFGQVVLLHPEGLVKIDEEDISLEKIVDVRREAKKKVFVANAIRALTEIAPERNLRNIPNVVLVGGSALDFEVPEMLMDELSNYKIVCGRGNIRRQKGPRNAVATGLIMSYVGEG